MNYYNRHVGDYARDAAHLSMIEDGAYTRLLDLYYTREGPIPNDEVERLCRVRGSKDRNVLRRILNEFFKCQDGKWIQKRCEKELEEYRRKCVIARKNGEKGGRPKTQRVISGFPNNNPDESSPITNNQEPITSNQIDSHTLNSGCAETQVEAGSQPARFGPADIETIYRLYPRHVGKGKAYHAIKKSLMTLLDKHDDPVLFLADRVEAFAKSPAGNAGDYTPYPATWFNQERYNDDPREWERKEESTRTHRSNPSNVPDPSRPSYRTDQYYDPALDKV